MSDGQKLGCFGWLAAALVTAWVLNAVGVGEEPAVIAGFFAATALTIAVNLARAKQG